MSWGLRPVVFDIGKQRRLQGATRIPLPARDALAGVAELLPAVQSLAIAAAARRVADFGQPRRSSKVTDGEAS